MQAFQTRSPGRIEFIGNHTDYNGGQVLGVALNLGVTAHATPLAEERLVLRSEQGKAYYDGPIDGFSPQEGDLSWANYPLGILEVLRSRGHRLRNGLELYFSSDLPAGAGLSSSAAIELATLEAIAVHEDIRLSKKEKVLLAQEAENRFVGVPCGILDQGVSCFGLRNHLVRIDCATTEFSNVRLPEGLHFWIFNTNQKHNLVDSMYATRNMECREALARIREIDPQRQHLAHVHVDILKKIRGGEDIRKRARHVVEENTRVLSCIDALALGDLRMVGKLLFDSHRSSRLLFENSTDELDTFVEILKDFSSKGVLGARLTGGGFGGAVMALTTDDFLRETAEQVVLRYREMLPEAPVPDVLHVVTGEGTRQVDV